MGKVGSPWFAPEARRALLHLPEADWPEADRRHFAHAFTQPQDVFAEDNGGNLLKPRTKAAIRYAYRRWLGWIAAHQPELMDIPPEDRATPMVVRAYVAALRDTCTPRTVASQLGKLHDALRYMHPAQD